MVWIQERDGWTMAFRTTTGPFEYWDMPHVPSSAPTVFQCLINDVLQYMQGIFIIAYINNIFTYSQVKETNIPQVKQVIVKLLANYLYAKVEKCEVHVLGVDFILLCYITGTEGVVLMDQNKVSATTNCPALQIAKGLESSANDSSS